MALGSIMADTFKGFAVGHTFGKQLPLGGGLWGGALGVTSAAGSVMNVLQQGTQFTNPMFNRSAATGYGKRGIDANNMNTNGLVQSLHGNRRRGGY